MLLNRLLCWLIICKLMLAIQLWFEIQGGHMDIICNWCWRKIIICYLSKYPLSKLGSLSETIISVFNLTSWIQGKIFSYHIWLALSDMFRLFNQTLNRTQKWFNSIFNSFNNFSKIFNTKFYSRNWRKTSSQKLGRHALHRVRSVWKSLGWVSFGSKKFSEKTLSKNTLSKNTL